MKFPNISLDFLIFVISLSICLSSNGQINDFLSYKTVLNTLEDKHLIEDLDYIENNWLCLDNKTQLIDQMLLEYSKQPEVYYLLRYLRAYDSFQNGWTRESINDILSVLNQKDLIYEGRFRYILAKDYLVRRDYANSYSSLNSAEKYFQKGDDLLGKMYISIQLMEYFGQIEDYEMVNKYYHDALLYCEQLNKNDGLITTYRLYATIIANTNLSLAGELFKKGWELAKRKNESIKVEYAVSYLKFLIRYGRIEMFDSVYYEIEELCDNNCNLSSCSVIATIYAHKMSKLNLIDSAIFFNNQALLKRKTSGKVALIGYSFLNLFSNNLNLDRMQAAKMNLDSAGKYFSIIDNIEAQKNYITYRLMYYNKTNNKDSIISLYKKLSDIENEYYRTQEDIYGSKIKAEYKIQNRLEKEKYENELKYRKQILIYLIVISVLLLIILIRVFILFIKKTRLFNILNMKSKVSFETIDEYKREIKQLKNIFENAITGFFILDIKKNIKYINKRAELMILSEESFVAETSFIELFSPEYQSDIQLKLNLVNENFANYEMQVIISKADQDQHINLSFSPMIINNKVESILVIALDISSRVKALELEKNQTTVLQTLFNSVTESIILMDGNGIIKLVNETGAKRLGKSINELIGANYYERLPETIKSERVEKITESLEQKKPIIYAENIDAYNTMVSIYPSFDSDGKVNYIAEFTQDITDRKLAYQQINSLRQKVLRSQMNPHFIFNSLNAIQSYVLKNDSEQAVKYLNSFARLIRMILDSSRFDYINLEKEINILEYYLQLQQLRFGDKFIWSLEVDKHIDTDAVLIPAMLAQPFIENAIEHGLQHLEGNGVVKISFKRIKDNIVFEVTDNGIGREASKSKKQNRENENDSLSTKIFDERLFTLNKYSGQKITYEIVDLKDDHEHPSGTSVIISLPVIYSSHLA